MNDDSLRRAYRDALAERIPGDHCASAEELGQLARREVTSAELTRGLDHVMSCPRCLPEFELLRAVNAAEHAGIAAVEPAKWRALPTRRVWLAAAVVVLMVGVVSVLPRARPDSAADPLRGGDAGVRLVVPAEAAVAPLPLALVWAAVPEVDRYDVEVLDDADAIAVATATTDTTWTIRADLIPGARYRWRVTAVTLSGGAVPSPIRSFTVRAR